ncbi:MAG TPA: MFS transporter [Candidatus Limnocylindria bacterium]|nr:MFS transporter [Candidatus Limnocylindria bacterium]
MSRRASFWAVAAFAFLAFAASTAASPLYRVYAGKFSFAPTTLTLLFTVYIVVLLGTLLVFGSVSDYTGRRTVMLAGLALGAAGCGVFLTAHGAAPLFAARALQGVAVGLLSGAASAALFDLRPNGGAAPLVSSAAPTGGQALGAIGASVLAQYAPAPTHLVWWLLLGAFITGVGAVLAMPEPGTVRPGVVSSLRPHVGVPQTAKGAFATAVPALVGIWALAGFYLSLGPSLAAQLLHSQNVLWGGILIFLLTGLAAAGSALLARKNPSAVMLGGCLVVIVGALMTFAAIETSTSAILFVGTAIAGLGFGPAFMGAFRATVAAATSYERTGLITAIYIVSYLGTGIPAVLAGIATSHYGLRNTALVYSVAVAVLAAVAVSRLLARQTALARAAHGTRHVEVPPGPGTVPPCAPLRPRPGQANA